MTRKILKLAAVFGIAAVALIFFAETTIKDPKPRPTLEWDFSPKDRTLDAKIEAYRVRQVVGAAFEAFLLQASLALALMGAAGLVLRRLVRRLELPLGWLRNRSNSRRPEPQPAPERHPGPPERRATRRRW